MSQIDTPFNPRETASEVINRASADPGTLHRVLRDASRRWRGAKLLGFALAGLAGLGGAVLAAVMLDAAFGFAAWGLVAIDAALVGLGVALLIGLLVCGRRSRHDPRRAAVALEHRSGVGSSRLINALDFSSPDRQPETDRLSPALRDLAVRNGEAAAARVDPRSLVDRATLRRSWVALLVVAVVFAGAAVVMPRVFAAVGPRLLSPWADLPPYTALRFDVLISAGDRGVIHVGKPGAIEVAITDGRDNRDLPTEATLIVVDDDGNKRPVMMHRTTRPEDFPPLESTPTDQATAATAVPEVGARNFQGPPHRFAVRFEKFDGPMEFYIDTPAGRSGRFAVVPETAPLFESLHATITPPDYTGFKPTTQRLSVDDAGDTSANGLNLIRAFRGSAVTLTVQSNVPLAEAMITNVGPRDGERRFAGHGGMEPIEAVFIVEQSATHTIRLIGIDDKASLHAVRFETVALEDRAPHVDILSPEPLALAVEGYPVPIRLVAKDDVGIASLKLHLNVADRDIEPTELAPDLPGASEAKVGVTQELDLAALGVGVGDTIRYFATARDNAPPGSFAGDSGRASGVGQLAETPVYQIQVISQQEWEEMARTQYGLEQMRAEVEAITEQLDALAEARAEILEQLKPLQEKAAAGEPLNDVERQQLRDLQQKLEDFAERARELAEALEDRAAVPSVYEFEEPFKERLKELAEQLEQQAEQAEATQEAAEPLGLPGIKPTEAETQEFMEQSQEFAERDEPFDPASQEERDQFEEELWKIELAEEMLFHAERIRAVIEQQREVETKLGELRWRDAAQLTPDEAQRLAGFAEREMELRDELEDAALMLRESAELAGPLLPRMSSTAIGLTEKLEGLEVYPDLERAAERAEAQEAPLAHAAAEVAADKLESLLSDAEGMPQQAESDLDQALSLPKAGMEKALQQMAQARAAQMARGMMQGGQGRGSGGSAGGRANASLIGPRSMGPNDSDFAGGGDEAGRGSRATPADYLDGPEAGDAESLNPDSTDTRGRSAVALPGVPARYQDAAAAYFQRLADEAARTDP